MENTTRKIPCVLRLLEDKLSILLTTSGSSTPSSPSSSTRQRWRISRRPETSEKPTNINGKKCTTPGCGKPLVGRGFCSACYYKKLRAAECGIVKIYPRGKTEKGCSTDSKKRGKQYN